MVGRRRGRGAFADEAAAEPRAITPLPRAPSPPRNKGRHETPHMHRGRRRAGWRPPHPPPALRARPTSRPARGPRLTQQGHGEEGSE